MKNSKNSGGIWMLVGLVGLLALPMIIDHFVNPAEAGIVQASAEAPSAATN